MYESCIFLRISFPNLERYSDTLCIYVTNQSTSYHTGHQSKDVSAVAHRIDSGWHFRISYEIIFRSFSPVYFVYFLSISSCTAFLSTQFCQNCPYMDKFLYIAAIKNTTNKKYYWISKCLVHNAFPLITYILYTYSI